MSFPKVKVGPLNFSALSLNQAIQTVLDWSLQPTGRAIHFANAYTVAIASKDSDYATTINSGDLICCDGTPVVWAGTWLADRQLDQWERVYGPDVMVGVLNASTNQHKHYLLGSTEETLTLLKQQITERFPHVIIVGIESPPFRPATESELIERDQRISDSGANIVWVGLGTPKQDFEVHRMKQSLPVTALAVGAAFDFLAGTVSQAPRWMQRSGTEWIYRWSKEPKRLTRRYLWGNPTFVRIVTQQKLTRNQSTST